MFFQHGSQDSLDVDVYVVLSKPILNLQECKEFCAINPEYNVNLICIEDGVVVWCYKGTIDECNNSILATFNLHSFNKGLVCPITKRLERNINLKIDRTIRGLLTYVSRTHLRKEVKEALRSSDINLKLSVLQKIKFEEIEDYGKKGKIEDVYKFFAFQIIQTTSLIAGKEIFTKKDAYYMSENSGKYLYRQVSDPKDTWHLQQLLNVLITSIKKYNENVL